MRGRFTPDDGSGSGSDVVNFKGYADPALELRTRLEAIIGRADPAMSTSFGPFTGVVRQDAGAQITEVMFELDRRTWVSVASESAGSDWNDLANSEGDASNTAVASLNEGLVLTQGTLIGDFPDPTGKTELTIDRVRLQCHYRVSQFLLAGTTLQVQYRIGALGVPTTLRTVTGGVTSPVNLNFLASGQVFDITADRAWTWQDLADLQVLYNGTILVDAGLSAVEVNATQLLVDASVGSDITTDPTLPVTDNLEWHFDASAITGLANNDPVATWNDVSGNGRNATQSDTARRPVYITSGIGGKPTVRFDGTNDNLATATISALAQPNTIFIVAKLIRTTGDGYFFDGRATSNRHALFINNGQTYWATYSGTVLTGGVKDGSPHVFVTTWAATDRLYVDGGAAAISGNGGSESLTGLTLGARFNAISPANLDISEAVVYSDALTTAELNDVGSYLAAKYGTTWTDI